MNSPRPSTIRPRQVPTGGYSMPSITQGRRWKRIIRVLHAMVERYITTLQGLSLNGDDWGSLGGLERYNHCQYIWEDFFRTGDDRLRRVAFDYRRTTTTSRSTGGRTRISTAAGATRPTAARSRGREVFAPATTMPSRSAPRDTMPSGLPMRRPATRVSDMPPSNKPNGPPAMSMPPSTTCAVSAR